MRPKRYYLGIDGGQSSTVALIADEEGRVIGQGKGGPCNHATGEAGRQKFFSAVSNCLEEAFREACLDSSQIEFEAACLGFSGGAADKEGYSRELIRSKIFNITHDATIALAGAMAGEPGVIVISGTGSMAFGKNSAGRTARAGGWGYVFGDEGGGFDLTRRALRASLRMEEGWGAATRLRAMLLEATNASDANALLHMFYTPEFTRPQIAALSKLVSEAAEDGDQVAQSILRDAAAALASYVQGVSANLFTAGQAVDVAYIGGGFQSALLRASFSSIVETSPGCRVKAPRMSPAAGAVLSALRLDGNDAALKNIPQLDK